MDIPQIPTKVLKEDGDRVFLNNFFLYFSFFCDLNLPVEAGAAVSASIGAAVVVIETENNKNISLTVHIFTSVLMFMNNEKQIFQTAFFTLVT